MALVISGFPFIINLFGQCASRLTCLCCNESHETESVPCSEIVLKIPNNWYTHAFNIWLPQFIQVQFSNCWIIESSFWRRGFGGRWTTILWKMQGKTDVRQSFLYQWSANFFEFKCFYFWQWQSKKKETSGCKYSFLQMLCSNINELGTYQWKDRSAIFQTAYYYFFSFSYFFCFSLIDR